MTAFRITLTALNDPTVHHTRDVEADTMCAAIETVQMLVGEKYKGEWEPESARRVWRPMINPVDADEIDGAPC